MTPGRMEAALKRAGFVRIAFNRCKDGWSAHGVVPPPDGPNKQQVHCGGGVMFPYNTGTLPSLEAAFHEALALAFAGAAERVTWSKKQWPEAWKEVGR